MWVPQSGSMCWLGRVGCIMCFRSSLEGVGLSFPKEPNNELHRHILICLRVLTQL